MQRKRLEYLKKLAPIEKLQSSKPFIFPVFDHFGVFMRFSAGPKYVIDFLMNILGLTATPRLHTMAARSNFKVHYDFLEWGVMLTMFYEDITPTRPSNSHH